MPATPDQTSRANPAATPAAPLNTLRWAVRVIAVETLALAGLTAYLVYQDLTARVDVPGIALGVTVYAALMTVLLAGLGHALNRLRSWARGPAIVLELLMLPIGYTMISSGLWLGAVVMAAGLGGAGTLLAPSTRAALGMR